MAVSGSDLTEQTRSVLERRMDVVRRVFAGAASFGRARVPRRGLRVAVGGRRQGVAPGRRARTPAAAMQRLPAGALDGTRILGLEASGEYGFVMFKTDSVPFGTDSYRIVDGKVAFHSNALYLPKDLR